MADIQIKDIPVVILAGGKGTRLAEVTHEIPKPMVSIGSEPILMHIMRRYAAFGFRNFIIAAGHLSHIIKDYYLNLPKYTADLIIANNSQAVFTNSAIADWNIKVVETGSESLTGRRIQRIAHYIDQPHFCLTYGDGLADVDFNAEWKFHLEHGKLGTICATHPTARFGNLEIDEKGEVLSFKEKAPLVHDYINGGFFIFKSAFLKRLDPAINEPLESTPLQKLAEEGQLRAFRHEGFWQCMDTVRDRDILNEYWESGAAPWTK